MPIDPTDEWRGRVAHVLGYALAAHARAIRANATADDPMPEDPIYMDEAITMLMRIVADARQRGATEERAELALLAEWYKR